MTQPFIQVIYASPIAQWVIDVPFVNGMTVQDAIITSDIEQLAQIEVSYVGIFGEKITNRDHQLMIGDRVEIYRPLTCDPKDVRRRRAERYPVGRIPRAMKKKMPQ